MRYKKVISIEGAGLPEWHIVKALPDYCQKVDYKYFLNVPEKHTLCMWLEVHNPDTNAPMELFIRVDSPEKFSIYNSGDFPQILNRQQYLLPIGIQIQVEDV